MCRHGIEILHERIRNVVRNVLRGCVVLTTQTSANEVPCFHTYSPPGLGKLRWKFGHNYWFVMLQKGYGGERRDIEG